MIKAVLFDFDGTLADDLELFVLAYNIVLKTFGIYWNKKEIVVNCFGKKEEEICAKLGIPQKAEEFTKKYYAAINKLFVKAKLFPDSISVLKYCQRKHIATVIITFASKYYISKMLKQLKIKNMFNLVISRDDVKNPKPDPEAVFLACKKLNIKPSEAIIISDSASDIIMGKKAGIKTVLFAPPKYNSFYNLELIKQSNPDFVIQKLEKLKNLIYN